MSIIPVLGRLSQEDSEFKASLDYIVRPSQNNKKRPGTVVHTYNPSYSGGRNQKDFHLPPVQAKSETLSQIIPNMHTHKEAGRVAQVV
jgi:hypothetical protein